MAWYYNGCLKFKQTLDSNNATLIFEAALRYAPFSVLALDLKG
jgi:hypothetical protein